jgi:NADH dehydrogenase FAD-containing subunit
MVVAAILFAHILSKFTPTKTHWKFQGKALPNSTFVWTPAHAAPKGMAFIHLWGNGSVTYQKHNLKLEGHKFIHVFGDIPTMYYSSNSVAAKAQVHLITDI